MKKPVVIFILFMLFSPSILSAGDVTERLEALISKAYNEINFEEKPDFEIFQKAVVGFYTLKSRGSLGDKELLTIIDFSKSSNQKRIWVLDMRKKEVIYHNLVAHGRNTGNEFATNFSNEPNSNKSSLGFYVTGENYTGKHGLSLRLDGMETGFNDNARDRAIVMHGASYVDIAFSKKYGRIGRSLGCPSIPVKGHEEVLTLIADKTCLYIYHPDQNYQESTKLLNEEAALAFMSAE